MKFHRSIPTLCWCILSLQVMTFLLGCGTKNDRQAAKHEFNEQDATTTQNAVLRSLRTSEVTTRIFSTGVEFNIALLNDVDHVSRYARRDKGVAAANFGVYLSDLKYAAAFDEEEYVKRYFEACLRLSEYCGIKKEFTQAVQFHFDEIIAGDEAFQKSVQKQIKDADNVSKGEEYQKAHASALAGYYIEELYHLVSFMQLYASETKADQVFSTLFETLITQKNELNSLIGYFDHIQLKTGGISAYQELLSIQKMYLALNTDQLLQETNPSLILKNKDLQQISEAIRSIRNRIVNS